MTNVKLQKKINSAKAKIEQVRGPATKRPETAPVLDAIRAFYADESYAFPTPPHRGGRAPAPRTHEVRGQASLAVLSKKNGANNRHKSWQVQDIAQKLAAE